jgi:hypothetical protein
MEGHEAQSRTGEDGFGVEVLVGEVKRETETTVHSIC